MSEFNPYAPPLAETLLEETDGSQLPLATRGSRLGAAILDNIILAVIIIPLQYFLRAYGSIGFGPQTIVAQLGVQLLWAVGTLLLWLVLNWKFLQNGQSIGKKLLNLQVQFKDGSKMPPMRIFLRRVVSVNVVAMIPLAGSLLLLIDACMIFRANRNTLHDDFAESKVVALRPRGM